MLPDHFRLLYDYNSWANHRALDACAALSEEQFARDLGSSFPSVRDTLAHILGAEWLWLERWNGRWHGALPPAEDFANLASLRVCWAEVERDLLEFVSTRTADDLGRILHYETTEGKPNSQAFWQMMQHLVNHGSYHRGQITTLLRQLGAEPVATDFILYLREGNPKSPAAPIQPETIRLLFDYNAWANHCVLEACAALSRERFTRQLTSSFPSVRDTVVHIVEVEWLYLERWDGRSPTTLTPAERYANPESIQQRWAEVKQEWVERTGEVSAQELGRVIEFKTTRGIPYAHALWQMLLHLVNHSTYHRGQVTTLLRQVGAQPSFSDLIYFYRQRAKQALD